MTRTRAVLTFDYLMPANSSPDEFLDVYHEPDDPEDKPSRNRRRRRQRNRQRQDCPRKDCPEMVRDESLERLTIRNKLRALLISIQPDCYVCGKPLQVTDPAKMENYANLVTSERKLACHDCAHAVWKGKQDQNREQQIDKLFAELKKLG